MVTKTTSTTTRRTAGTTTPATEPAATKTTRRRSPAQADSVERSADTSRKMVGGKTRKDPAPSLPERSDLKDTVTARMSQTRGTARPVVPPTTPPPPDGLTVGDESSKVKRAEKMLKRAGFNAGKADGKFTTRTADAVKRFQEAAGMNATGVLDDKTLGRLGRVDKRVRQHKGKLLGPGQASKRIGDVERKLSRLGYDVGKRDGVYDADTARAVQRFKRDEGLEKTKKGNKPSTLMGERAQKELVDEGKKWNHQPYHSRVKASRDRRKWDAAMGKAVAKERDGVAGLSEGLKGQAVKYAQQHLRAAGFSPGKADGKFDERTTGAVKEFQRKKGLEATGVVDADTWAKLKGSTLEAKGRTDPAQRVGERSGAVKKTEKMLKELGYNPGKIDGVYSERTQKAVDKFRKKKKLGSVGSGVSDRVDKAMRKAIKQKRNSLPTRWDTGYRSGVPYKVKLAKVDGYWTGVNTAKAYQRMERAAKKDGIDLNIVSGFRTMAKQRELYNLYGPGRAATPGYSNHQNGSALDLNVQTGSAMSVGVGPVYNWLARNAGRFGFRRIPLEAWHWEYQG